MNSILERSLTLVGPGRAGRAFARSWTAAGGRIAHLIVRAGAAPSAPELAGAAVHAMDETFPDSPDILVLAVPDDAIAAVASSLAAKLRCRLAFHLSGALGSERLAAFRRDGAAVASLHPLRPFIGAEDEDWRGAFVAVEGDPTAADEGERIARAVAARPYRLSAEAKPLYHAAASLAAGGVAAVLSVAVRICAKAGVPEEMAREALSGLASRAAAAAGHRRLEEVFTGAVARRDVGTVRAHVAALSPYSDALELYRVLAEEILRTTAGRGREQEIRDILRGRE